MTRRAFTLVELLVTVSVLAFLAAFTVPTYQLLLSQLQLNSAVNEAANFIRTAQQRTVTEQQVYGITLTLNDDAIPMFVVQGATSPVIGTMDLPNSIEVGSISFGGQTDIRFSAAGAPSTSGSFTLRDTIRNRSRTIEIRPSGTVRANTSEQ